jgi:GNAT superfamily N-acetyltransferase
MNLRNTSVFNTKDRKQFLREVLANTPGFPPFDIGEIKGSPFSFVAKERGASRQLVRLYMLDAMDGSIELQSCSVVKAYQGRGIGQAQTKAAIGVAFERGQNTLRVKMVNDDGPLFWSLLGAVPTEEPKELGVAMRWELHNHEKFIPAEMHQRLLDLADIAEANPYLGWQLLSQDKTLLSKDHPNGLKSFKELIFKQVFDQHHDMVFLLGHEQTRKILEKRLGVLPPFRPIEPDNYFAHIFVKLNRCVRGAKNYAL